VNAITTPRDLFLHELGDILYVERKLAGEVLPKLIDEVSDEEFKSGLEKHLEQTKRHVKNVETVFGIFDEQPHEEECVGFERLKKEHDQLLMESSSSLVDSIDLGAAARTENYEIAAYEGLRRMAKALGEEDAVTLLDENLTRRRKHFARSRRSRRESATRASRRRARAIVLDQHR
jgi:ferritin-like metal-binding protein YciE